MRDLVQGTEDWHDVRRGKVTASRVADLIAKTKSGWAASRAKYEAELIAERLTGQTTDGFKSAAMLRGNEVEPDARTAYAFLNDADVAEIGFVDHPRIQMAGASPDGLVGKDGLVEIKCPDTHTHIDMLLRGKVPGRYLTQMQWQMACTGRAWCDFVSYDPRLPERHQIFVTRVKRDGERISQLETEVAAFLEELEDKIARLETA